MLPLSFFFSISLVCAQEPGVDYDVASGMSTRLVRTARGFEAKTSFHHNHGATPTIPQVFLQGGTGSAPGLRWTADLTSGNWRPDTLAMGDRDSTILCGVIGIQDGLVLYSTHDVDPPSPIWVDTSVNGLDYLMPVAAAKETDLMTAIYGKPEGATYRPFMNAYSSQSNTPDFHYDFPVTNPFSITWLTTVAANGSKFAGCFDNDTTFQVFLNVFDAQGQSLFTRNLGIWNAEWLELSADGDRLYLAEWDGWVLDANDGTTIFRGPAGLFGANDFSADGTAFCGGGFTDIWVYRDQGGGNFNQASYWDSVSGIPVSMKLSADGTRLAAGFWSWNADSEFTVLAYDVTNDQVVWTRTFVGTGTLQSSPEVIDGDANLDRFVIGHWGDAGQTWPELMVFDFFDSDPIYTLDTPGSVTDVVMSEDGRHVAATSKSAHSNQSAFGGYVHMIDLGELSLDVQGALQLGQNFGIELYGDPGDVIHAATANNELEQTLPGIDGIWYLDQSGPPNIYRDLGSRVVPATGTATLSFQVPLNSSLLGQRFYFQGVVEPASGATPFTTNEMAARILP